MDKKDAGTAPKKKPIVRVTFEMETDDVNQTIAGLEEFKHFLNCDYFECSLGEHVRSVSIQELEPAESQAPTDEE